jgi:thioredoxin 1
LSWFSRGKDFEELSTAEDLSAAMAVSDDRLVLLFKHSKLCGSSYRAQREVMRLTDEVAVFRLVVQHARELSRTIEEALGIRHETPQVILLHRRQPIFSASHGRVKAERIRQAISDPEIGR